MTHKKRKDFIDFRSVEVVIGCQHLTGQNLYRCCCQVLECFPYIEGWLRHEVILIRNFAKRYGEFDFVLSNHPDKYLMVPRKDANPAGHHVDVDADSDLLERTRNL